MRIVRTSLENCVEIQEVWKMYENCSLFPSFSLFGKFEFFNGFFRRIFWREIFGDTFCAIFCSLKMSISFHHSGNCHGVDHKLRSVVRGGVLN